MSTLPKRGRTWHPQSSNQPVMGSFAVFLFGTTTVTGDFSGLDVELRAAISDHSLRRNNRRYYKLR